MTSLVVITLLGVGLLYMLRLQSERRTGQNVITISPFLEYGRWHLAALLAALLATGAWGSWLDRFAEMYRQGGLFAGPGYSDLFGTIPLLTLKAVVLLVGAGVVLVALPRRRYREVLGVGVMVVVVWIGASLYTSGLHRFVVSPNELEKERPYLKEHITATNLAFGLDRVKERGLTEDDVLSAQDVARNRATINNVRLWDHEPLLETFSQIQEIRTYYKFESVDNDRYVINGELRQTMLSPREMNQNALPSRTWVNQRLTFTHGYGLTLGPVNRVNEQGLPVLLVKDLPPKSEFPELAVKQPQIYFGEVEDEYVFVHTHQQEFDYPEGDANIFSTYAGTGGVPLDSWPKRLLLAAYLKDMKMLLSDDFTPETRVLLMRNIVKLVTKLAPFLQLDRDPYLVITEGKLVWIMDGYTLTDRYPYAQQVAGIGNYIRNSVKITVDARDGTVRFYLADPHDPIIAAYAALLPGMFHPLEEMPAGLRVHLRHPEDLFSIQCNMYTTYHMLDVNTFYNKEDQWAVPVVGQKSMVPYWMVMKLPGEGKEEFILMLPLTLRLTDNLAAWMVARTDGEHLGQLLVYTFPKQKVVFGPRQMVARINQDPAVSQQITLWDTSGSNVIRGTLLVIPIENSLIYVQPLYLKATDGRIPELKRVVAGYQDQIAMGVDLEDALGQIFGPAGKAPRTPLQAKAASRAQAAQMPSLPGSPTGGSALGRQAMQHYNAMQEASRQGDWGRFGRELEQLGNALRQLAK